MKICTKCNHVIRNDDVICPYYEQTVETSENKISGYAEAVQNIQAQKQALDIVDEVNYATVSLNLPRELFEEKSDSPYENIVEPKKEDYEFGEQELIAEPEPKQKVTAEPEEAPLCEMDNPVPDFDAEAPYYGQSEQACLPPVEGELELEAKEFAASMQEKDDDKSGIFGKVGVSLLAVMICALFVFTVSCLVKYMKGPVASDGQIMLEYLSGSWVSEPFVFADDDSKSYVELFTINSDGTFTLKHLITDTRYPEGYKDGTWETDYQIGGTAEFLSDSQCIIIKYTEFGKDYYFDRYIVKVDDDLLTLREFYDDAATKSYDINYSRVG